MTAIQVSQRLFRFFLVYTTVISPVQAPRRDWRTEKKGRSPSLGKLSTLQRTNAREIKSQCIQRFGKSLSIAILETSHITISFNNVLVNLLNQNSSLWHEGCLDLWKWYDVFHVERMPLHLLGCHHQQIKYLKEEDKYELKTWISKWRFVFHIKT